MTKQNITECNSKEGTTDVCESISIASPPPRWKPEEGNDIILSATTNEPHNTSIIPICEQVGTKFSQMIQNEEKPATVKSMSLDKRKMQKNEICKTTACHVAHRKPKVRTSFKFRRKRIHQKTFTLPACHPRNLAEYYNP